MMTPREAEIVDDAIRDHEANAEYHIDVEHPIDDELYRDTRVHLGRLRRYGPRWFDAELDRVRHEAFMAQVWTWVAFVALAACAFLADLIQVTSS